MRLRLQGFGPAGDLRESGVDVALVERTRQVWFASLDQHGWQASTQARQRPLQRIALRRWVQWHIAVVLRPGIVVMWLTLKAIKSEHLVLLVIRATKHMNTDALIILQTAVLDAKAEYSGRDVGRLCGVSIIAGSLHHVSSSVRLQGRRSWWGTATARARTS